MANRKKNPQGIKTSLTPAELRRVIAAETAYTEHVKANPMVWLPDSEIITLDHADVGQYGFSGLVRPQDLKFDISDLNVDDLENLFKRARGKGGKGGGGKQRKPSGPQSMPSAQVAKQVVATYFAGMQPAGATGNIVFGEQNALFGDAQKAITYHDAWELIVLPHHIMFWSEVGADFLKEIGQAFNLNYWCSKANTRNQAVGITASKRFNLVAGPFSYDKVATVQGIPDLRPGWCVVLEDTWSGLIIKVVVNHLKSMRGGPKLTSPVRYQQCVEIVKAHGKATTGIKPALKNQQTRNIWRNQIFGRGFLDHGTTTVTMPLCVLPAEERNKPMAERIKNAITVMAGDWNTFLDNTTDVDPLIQAGYLLLNPGDKTPTHSMGSRLDGFFAEKANNPSCDVDVQDGPDEVQAQ